MKNIKILFIGLFLAFSFQFSTKGQEVGNDYPISEPIVRVFANYHFGLNEYSPESAFDITRAYLGYDIKISENFSFKTNIDVGNPKDGGSYEYTAYLKTAELKYQKEKLTVHAGLIGLKQFKEQENNWGYRYIYKSFQDEHKFGSSADQGIMLEYQLTDNFLIDATVRNGEGYKIRQTDNTYNAALGLTYKIGKSITLRGYYELASKTISQSVISGFIGYTNKDMFNVGVEFNYMQNNSFIEDQNLRGVSSYLTYVINEKYQIFGRFDKLCSNVIESETDAWNIAKNGEAIIAGLQYKLEKNIKISTNLQYWSSDEPASENQMFMYINLEYKFKK